MDRATGVHVTNLHVVATALNAPTEDKCRESCRDQTVFCTLHYVNAGLQSPVRFAIQNRYDVVMTLAPQDIVVELDGDDWLARRDALEIVAKMYEDPEVWMTWGSFVCADGRPGCSAPYTTTNYRQEEWKASHLKTYRAALFHKLRQCDLKRADGSWRYTAIDQAVMFPMLEMCGPEHSRFCPEILYVYNYANSFEFNADAAGLRLERDGVAEVRALPPMKRLVSL